MKAVLFAAGLTRAPSPLDKFYLHECLPVLNKPLIVHYIESLRNAGVIEFKIIAHRKPEQIDSIVSNGEKLGVQVSYLLSPGPPRTANSLLKFASFLNDRFIVLIVSGFPDVDWQKLFSDFRNSQLLAAEFYCMQNNSDKNVGYIFNPQLVPVIVKNKFSDIENQLIPHIKNHDNSFDRLKLDGSFHTINSFKSYIDLNFTLLSNGASGTNMLNNFGISEIHPQSSITQPFLLGDKSTIAKSVIIDGPCIIGDKVSIDRGAYLKSCIVLNDSYIGRGVEVNNALVVKNNYIKFDTAELVEIKEKFIIGRSAFFQFHRSVDHILIRLFDIFTVFMLLLVLSPVLIVYALFVYGRTGDAPLIKIEYQAALRGSAGKTRNLLVYNSESKMKNKLPQIIHLAPMLLQVLSGKYNLAQMLGIVAAIRTIKRHKDYSVADRRDMSYRTGMREIATMAYQQEHIDYRLQMANLSFYSFHWARAKIN